MANEQAYIQQCREVNGRTVEIPLDIDDVPEEELEMKDGELRVSCNEAAISEHGNELRQLHKENAELKEEIRQIKAMLGLNGQYQISQRGLEMLTEYTDEQWEDFDNEIEREL